MPLNCTFFMCIFSVLLDKCQSISQIVTLIYWHIPTNNRKYELPVAPYPYQHYQIFQIFPSWCVCIVFICSFILIVGSLLYNIVVFSAIHWHDSGMGVHVSPILTPGPTSLPIPSLWVVPEHPLWVPCFMHWTCSGLCFTYGDIHVSVLFSQITSPSAPPTESISLSFTSVSLPLPCIQDPCVCANILYRVLSLTSLCMMGFRLVHLIGTDSMCPL